MRAHWTYLLWTFLKQAAGLKRLFHVAMQGHTLTRTQLNHYASAVEEHPAPHRLACSQACLSHSKPMSEPQEIRKTRTHINIDSCVHTRTRNKTCWYQFDILAAALQRKTCRCAENAQITQELDFSGNHEMVTRNRTKKYESIPPALVQVIPMMHWGQWDELGLWQDRGLLYSGLTGAEMCACVLRVGAFGVNEVSGLRVLLCEAAALQPSSCSVAMMWCLCVPQSWT